MRDSSAGGTIESTSPQVGTDQVIVLVVLGDLNAPRRPIAEAISRDPV